MSSDSITELKFMMGTTKREVTKEEAKAMGAGAFSMRMHVFVPTRDRAQIFFNLIPGSPATLPAGIIAYNGLESFPVLSFPMKNMDKKEYQAEIFPPADPGVKYGIYSLGLINTLAIAAPGPPGDGQEVGIDPGQLVRCSRYDLGIYRVNHITYHKLATINNSTT